MWKILQILELLDRQVELHGRDHTAGYCKVGRNMSSYRLKILNCVRLFPQENNGQDLETHFWQVVTIWEGSGGVQLAPSE